MSLKNLQKQAGVEADGVFGPRTFFAAADYLGISHTNAAHFFAQTSHETGEFSRFEENLNYGWKGLRKVFPKYFKTDEKAQAYARHPERIANLVYANRMGNGDEASGDGWRYRGMGAIQNTGKNNRREFADAMGDPEIMTNPRIMAEKYSFISAVFFFKKNGLWKICEKGLTDQVVEELTRRINGGLKGIEHRKELTEKYKEYLS